MRAAGEMPAGDREARADRAGLKRGELVSPRFRGAEEPECDREQIVRRGKEATPVDDPTVLGWTAAERRSQLSAGEVPTGRRLDVFLRVIDDERLERRVARQHRGGDDRFDHRGGAVTAEARV